MRSLASLLLALALVGGLASCHEGESVDVGVPAKDAAAPAVVADATVAHDAAHVFGLNNYAYPVGPAQINEASAGTYPNLTFPVCDAGQVWGTNDGGASMGCVAGGGGAVVDSGITQLTGQVTAGPGSGSQVATITAGTSGQIFNSSAVPASQWVTVSGDCTISATGVVTCAKINGTTVPAGGALTTGNTLGVTGASAASWSALNLAGGAGYVSGALPIANVAPGTSAQVLMSNASPATTWTTLSGDTTIGATGVTATTKVNGISISGTPAIGNQPVATSTSASSWAALNLAGGSNFVTGLLPAANLGTITLTGDTTGAASGGTVATTTVQCTGSGGVCTIPNGTNASFLKTSGTVSTNGRINFSGDFATEVLMGIRNFNGTLDLPVIRYNHAGFLDIGSDVTDSGTYVNYGANGNYIEFQTTGAGAVVNSTKWAFTSTPIYMDSGSNLTVGGTTADFGGGVGVLAGTKATTNPSTNPTGYVQFADHTNGNPCWRGSAGTVSCFPQ